RLGKIHRERRSVDIHRTHQNSNAQNRKPL
ncbi:MAG: hypothetical protein ACI932_002566, partial [Paracoccaceae bacterium]